ncbi:MAG: HYR domain-containing protein, partial [Bacteroidota bacterium]
EITNFGPASIDLSCLVVERYLGTNFSESFVVPQGAFLNVGDVMVIHWGVGTDDPANLYYNVGPSANLSHVSRVAYSMSFEGTILDVAAFRIGSAVGGQVATATTDDWTGNLLNLVRDIGGYYRKWTWDSNSRLDWDFSDVCAPATIGSLNPGLELLTDNGQSTSLQSLPGLTEECSFTVTMEDTELPMCVEFDNITTYTGTGGDILNQSLLSSVIRVPDNFVIGDVNVAINGSHPDMGELIFKLISPAGTEVELVNRECPRTLGFELVLDSDSTNSITTASCIEPFGSDGTYSPANSLTVFNDENSGGDWTLLIADLFVGADEGVLTDWAIEIAEKVPYSQMDTILSNDPRLCSAEFTWNHPRLVDNCLEGSIEVKYSADSIDVPMSGIVEGGTLATEVFSVGETTVTYVLTDKSGNQDSCSFVVTVNDDEAPMVVCPNDITLNLGPGECDIIVNYVPANTSDNCGVVDTLYSIPSGTGFEAGLNVVTIIVLDEAGNSDTCDFNVIVEPYVPTDDIFICNDLVNVSLDRECCAVITADMLLEGDDYACYDDYCIEITDLDGNVVGTTDSLGEYVPKVTEENVGDSLIVSIANCITGNSCWGYIFIEDKLQPVIECPADTVVACNQLTDISITGEVTLLSCEDNPTITYEDNYVDNGRCSSPRATIERTWTVTDASGNFATCTQLIEVEGFELDQIEFPQDYQMTNAFTCVQVNNNPTITDPENTGYPTIDGQPIFGDHLCEIRLATWDKIFVDVSCPSSYTILRHWEILNECLPVESGVNPIEHIQEIEVNDFIDPSINASAEIDSNFIDHSGCNTRVIINVNASDQCTDTEAISYVVYRISNIGSTQIFEIGTANSQIFDLLLPSGYDYRVAFRVEDMCNNVARTEVNFTLEDIVPPTAVCDRNTTTSIDGSGVAKVFAETFDDGSHDNCSGVYFKVRRMVTGACDLINGDDSTIPGYQEWMDDYVKYCCEDTGDTLQVIFRVYDVDPGPGPVNPSREGPGGDLYGRYNDCMV